MIDELAKQVYGSDATKEQTKELRSIIGRTNPVPIAAMQIVELYGIEGISFLERLVYPLDLAPEGRALVLLVSMNTNNRIGSFLSILSYTERLDYGETPASILRNIERYKYSFS